jgi:hypothetical protein
MAPARVRVSTSTKFIAFSLNDFDVHIDATAMTAANELLILHTTAPTRDNMALEPLMLEELPIKAHINAHVLDTIDTYIVKNTPFKRSYRTRPKLLKTLRRSQQRIFRNLCLRARIDMVRAVCDAYGYVPINVTQWTYYKK